MPEQPTPVRLFNSAARGCATKVRTDLGRYRFHCRPVCWKTVKASPSAGRSPCQNACCWPACSTRRIRFSTGRRLCLNSRSAGETSCWGRPATVRPCPAFSRWRRHVSGTCIRLSICGRRRVRRSRTQSSSSSGSNSPPPTSGNEQPGWTGFFSFCTERWHVRAYATWKGN